MAGVTVTVELSTSAPFAASPSWTDITDYVDGPIDVVAGWDRKVRETQPSAGRLTLQNGDRRFDPTHTTSPFYPNLRPRNQVRVKVELTGTPSGTVTVPIAHGYVRAWPQRSSMGDCWAQVDIEWDDAQSLLERTPMPRSLWDWLMRKEVASFELAVWHRFDDRPGTGTATDSSTNARHGVYYAGWLDSVPAANYFAHAGAGVSSTAPIVPYGDAPGLDFGSANGRLRQSVDDGSSGHYDAFQLIRIADAAQPTTTSWTVEMWVVASQPDPPANQCLWHQGSHTALYILADGRIQMFAGGGNVTYTGANRVLDGAPHHLIFQRDGTSIQCWIDKTSTTNTSATTLTQPLAAGNSHIGGFGPSLPFMGTMSEFFILTRGAAVPGPTAETERYDAGFAPWNGQTTNGRVGAVLDLAGWPAGLRDLSTGVVTSLAPARFDSMSTLDALRRVAASEGGRVGVDRQNRIVFRNRTDTTTGTTVTLPDFADNGAPGVTPYAEAVFTPADEDMLVNRVTVEWPGGPPVEVNLSTSTLQQFEASVDTDLPTWTAASSLATALATAGATEVTSAQIEVGPVNAAEFLAVASLEPGSAVRLRRWPQGQGEPVSWAMVVDQVRHTIAPPLGEVWSTVIDMVGAKVEDGWTVFAEAGQTGQA